MAGLLRIIIQRLLLGLVTLFAVSIIIFVAVNALPGDFAEAILGQGATPEAVNAIREQLGLNQNAFTRYVTWLGGVLRGDLGVPLSQALFAGNFGTTATGPDVITVVEQITPRLKNTLYLAGVSAAIAVPLAVTLGILTALYRNSAFDRAMNVSTLSAISSPEFFIAYVLILFLAVLNPILPSLSNVNPEMAWFGWERLERTLLPALVLTLAVTAQMMRMTRAAIINLLASPLYRNGAPEGPQPNACHRGPCIAQRPCADHHRDCAEPRIPGYRRRRDRGGLRLPRHRPILRRQREDPRHPRGAGLLPHLRGGLHPPEPDS